MEFFPWCCELRVRGQESAIVARIERAKGQCLSAAAKTYDATFRVLISVETDREGEASYAVLARRRRQTTSSSTIANPTTTPMAMPMRARRRSEDAGPPARTWATSAGVTGVPARP